MVAANHNENMPVWLSACSAPVPKLSAPSYTAKAGNLKTTTWILAADWTLSIKCTCPSFGRQK